MYSAFAAVSGAEVKSLVDELVNLNTLSPVLHLGFVESFGSGIANEPETAPLASVS